ncbi:putative zinc-binding protein [Nitratidesulfovibrio sp. HK-II]|uniref:putative zinc-binding protein n=1 Tax=Nitratidesulfovibrio sp. HK-II TaxID=2009266 RepID=UPI000E2F29A1|nr:putative zinc-binding protein [Nitratidesulfovibrio sp. HK-II]GBO95549.1 conserved protein [Nitratidesulfovibrio sp. HK-II]
MSGCCGNAGEVMILACSGGSNVGQITNQAAVELTREGHGKMFCLAGIGAQLQGFVKSAQDTSRIVVLDGCPVGCARKIMENAQVSGWEYLVLTDLGIEKVKDRELAIPVGLVEQAKAAVRALHPATPSGTGCCA